MPEDPTFLLKRVQPRMGGRIEGSLSTLARIFAVVLASHDTRFAFIAGLATSIGAAISMGFSEALSDTGEVTGRGRPRPRGALVARADPRRRHVPRRHPPFAAVPDRQLPRGALLRSRGGRARTAH